MDAKPIVNFALGCEVSTDQFFKSNFARSVASQTRSYKSLEHNLFDSISKEPEESNNFFSLVNFEDRVWSNCAENVHNKENFWNMNENQSFMNIEIQKLQNQCEYLKRENRRLKDAVECNQVPSMQVLDTVYLQAQIDALQWQIKQTDYNKQMYRSLMEQVVCFLDRARKSLDILHEKSNTKGKRSEFPRTRSLYDDGSLNPVSPSVSALPNSSRFIRAKSTTQISSGKTGRDVTWSILRRNDPGHSTPPCKSQNLNKTHEGVVYRKPVVPELNPDEVSPHKLSEEAFRLMRTVQSLLLMREPELARDLSMELTEPSPLSTDHHRRTDHHTNHHTDHHHTNHHTNHDINHHTNHHNELSVIVQNSVYMNTVTVQKATNRGIESSSIEETRICVKPSTDINGTHPNLLPDVRRSLDAVSLISESITEDEDVTPHNSLTTSLPDNVLCCTTSTSTPKKVEEEKNSKPSSVSSVEDESGFSSLSSSQEVGLPNATTISPIRGYHTEIGLPLVPLEKTKSRKWTMIPVELQALFKKHRKSLRNSQTNREARSVWV